MGHPHSALALGKGSGGRLRRLALRPLLVLRVGAPHLGLPIAQLHICGKQAWGVESALPPGVQATAPPHVIRAQAPPLWGPHFTHSNT